MKTVQYNTLNATGGASKRAFEVLMKTISEQFCTIDKKLAIRSVVINNRDKQKK